MLGNQGSVRNFEPGPVMLQNAEVIVMLTENVKKMIAKANVNELANFCYACW